MVFEVGLNCFNCPLAGSCRQKTVHVYTVVENTEVIDTEPEAETLELPEPANGYLLESTNNGLEKVGIEYQERRETNR